MVKKLKLLTRRRTGCVSDRTMATTIGTCSKKNTVAEKERGHPCLFQAGLLDNIKSSYTRTFRTLGSTREYLQLSLHHTLLRYRACTTSRQNTAASLSDAATVVVRSISLRRKRGRRALFAEMGSTACSPVGQQQNNQFPISNFQFLCSFFDSQSVSQHETVCCFAQIASKACTCTCL